MTANAHSTAQQPSASEAEDTARILAETAARFLAEQCPPAKVRQAESDASVRASLWAQLDELGLSQACAPETEGGSGLGWSAIRGLIEVCGEHALPVALPERLAAQLCARAAGLSLLAGQTQTLALGRRDGGKLVADAVPGALSGGVVLVQLEGSWQVLAVDAARRESALNSAGEDRSRLIWAAPEAAADSVAEAAFDLVLAGAAIRSAQIAGAARRALSMAVTYANDRSQFGKPIGKFQAVQQQLAVAAEWSAMATMGARLAFSDAGTALNPDLVAGAREVACHAAEQVAGIAHAVHGAIGVTADYDLQLFSRRLKAWAAEFGSSRYWAARLGERVIADGRPQVWDRVVTLVDGC